MPGDLPARALAVALALAVPVAQAAELTGRVSVAGVVAHARQGDVGREDAGKTLTADQETLRLMLDHAGERDEWSVHLKVSRLRATGYLAGGESHPFRRRKLGADWTDKGDGRRSLRVGYEFDRAVYRLRGDAFSLGAGRQPIDWGSGRLWQPLNVFGAFAPTDLDTEFKPGIDALTADWYPSAFSSLTGAVVLASGGDGQDGRTGVALRYRGAVGAQSEMSLLAGRVTGHNVLGGSLEGAWGGTGWRVEAAHYRLGRPGGNAWFAIAGVDRRLDDGTVVVAEWHRNTNGARTRRGLAARGLDLPGPAGLHQQLGRDVLGIALERQLTPLLAGSYLLLAAPLEDDSGGTAFSVAHQAGLTYSLGDESDLLFSVLLANGKGLGADGGIRSEFGHLPASATVRVRLYF